MMTLDEYQAEAVKTLHKDADPIYLAGKLMREAAEVAEPLLKFRYHGKALDQAALMHELGDTLWYLATLADLMGWSLDDVAAANVANERLRLLLRQPALFDPDVAELRILCRVLGGRLKIRRVEFAEGGVFEYVIP